MIKLSAIFGLPTEPMLYRSKATFALCTATVSGEGKNKVSPPQKPVLGVDWSQRETIYIILRPIAPYVSIATEVKTHFTFFRLAKDATAPASMVTLER